MRALLVSLGRFLLLCTVKVQPVTLCGSHQPGVRGSEMAVTGQQVDFCEAASSMYFFHSLCVAEIKHTVSRFNLTLSSAYCVIHSKASGGEDTDH